MQTKTMTVTFRTEPLVKARAERLFNSMGMSLSCAIDMFLHQAVMENKYPCSLDSKVADSRIKDMSRTYPAGFFELFGSLPELDIQEKADSDLPGFDMDLPREEL